MTTYTIEYTDGNTTTVQADRFSRDTSNGDLYLHNDSAGHPDTVAHFPHERVNGIVATEWSA